MRRKAPLTMMELMVMTVVFALCAALCLQAFVKSDDLSQHSAARDRAVTEAQSAAETLRAQGGDMGGALSRAAEALNGDYAQGVLWVDYDENWNPIDYDACGMEAPPAAYRLTAQGVPTDVPGLEKALVSVAADRETGVIFEIEVAWQEVSSRG